MHSPSTASSPLRLGALLLMLLLGTSCMAHRHSVGLGGTGTNAQDARQYYILFGLIRANDVNAPRMAAGLTSYEVETRYAFFDMLIAPLLLPLTMTSRTVTVRT